MTDQDSIDDGGAEQSVYEHLAEIEEGAGCTDIWEHLSEFRWERS